MKTPAIGTVVYDSAGHPLGKVVRTEGTTIWYVPIMTEVVGTHKGNVHNALGEREWMA